MNPAARLQIAYTILQTNRAQIARRQLFDQAMIDSNCEWMRFELANDLTRSTGEIHPPALRVILANKRW